MRAFSQRLKCSRTLLRSSKRSERRALNSLRVDWTFFLDAQAGNGLRVFFWASERRKSAGTSSVQLRGDVFGDGSGNDTKGSSWSDGSLLASGA
jgi:hypothetical protein